MISAIFLALQKEDKENINFNEYTSETLQNLNDKDIINFQTRIIFDLPQKHSSNHP